MPAPNNRPPTLVIIGKSGLILAVCLLFIVWWWYTPPGLLGKAAAIGYAFCHRIVERSFSLAGQPLPLCARCTGLYLGALLGLIFQAGCGRRLGGYPARRFLIFFGALGLAYALDGLNSFLQLMALPGLPPIYLPNNALRLATGTGMGLSIAIVLYPAFVQATWGDWENRPALANSRRLLELLGLAAGLDVIFLADIPLINYGLALASALGVLVMLSMVYTLAGILLFKMENRFWKISQLLLPLAGGFGLALLQVALFDGLRYALTGTWNGFIIG